MAKILLVDDSEPNRDMLARRLRRNGYEILTAADGQQAVDIAEAELPDLILMDLNLPVLDGWLATQRIRQSSRARSIPVVALTAHALSGDKDKALEAGCDDYETKPVDLPRLLGKMQSLLGKREKQQAQLPHPQPQSPIQSARAVKPPPQEGSAPSGAPPEQHPGGHVLVVDDTEDNRDVLCRRMERNGYTVDVAQDGREALEMLEVRRYDAVLLDIMMPDISGLEVLKTIRQTKSATELPVLMATALNASDHIVSALELGANDYVTKPLDFAVVLARVRTQILLRRAVEQIRALEQDLERRNRELQTANQVMRNDLDAAAKVQAALLPAASPKVPGYEFAWLFKPSATLAGDLLNVFRLDEGRTGVFVLDVSGHGVAASLLSVTVSRFLSPIPDPSSMLWRQVEGGGYELETPAAVAARLGQRFPFDDVTNQFLTLVYGVLDTRRHELHYVSAGHPNIISVTHDGAAKVLEGGDYPIGVGPDQYVDHAAALVPGQRLYLYSDGITEARSPGGKLFGQARLVEVLQSARDESLVESIELVWAAVADWTGGVVPGDDQTIVAIERNSGGA